jgi:hypothetical protein
MENDSNQNIDQLDSQFLPKERHGCLTAWLILMLIANAATALIYFLASDMIAKNLPVPLPTSMAMLLGLVGLCNVLFAVFIFKWKKWGFWGFVATSIIALGINLSLGLGIGQSILGLIGIAVFYGVLQIKQNGVSGWANLE